MITEEIALTAINHYARTGEIQDVLVPFFVRPVVGSAIAGIGRSRHTGWLHPSCMVRYCLKTDELR